MNILTQLIEQAQANAVTTDWPYGESYYKNIVCKASSGKITFMMNYKRATKAQVIKALETI